MTLFTIIKILPLLLLLHWPHSSSPKIAPRLLPPSPSLAHPSPRCSNIVSNPRRAPSTALLEEAILELVQPPVPSGSALPFYITHSSVKSITASQIFPVS